MTRPVALTGLLVPCAVFLLLPLAIGLAGEGDEAGALGFRVVTSAEFLRHDAAQPFDRVDPFADHVKEGFVSSRIHSTGVCHLVPVPCRERMALLAVIQGGATSRSVLSRAHIDIFTREATCFWLVREIFLDGAGIWVGGTQCSFPTHSDLDKVTTRFHKPTDGLIRGLTGVGFCLGQPWNDRTITRETEQRMQRDGYSDTVKELKDLNKWYHEDFLASLWKSGARRSEVRFSSSRAAMQYGFHLDGQSVPPAPPLPSWPIAMQLHPLTINELSNRRLAGKTYEGKEFEQGFKDIGRYLELPTVEESEHQPWSVKLAQRDPLTLRLDAGAIETTLRVESFTSGESTYPGMNLTVCYHVVRRDGALKLVRTEKLDVLPEDYRPGMHLGARQEVARSLMRRRFGRLLPREVAFRDLTPPPEMSLPGTLRVELIDTAQGWLNVGLGYRVRKSQ